MNEPAVIQHRSDNAVGRNHRAKWGVSCGQSFGHGKDIGRDAPMFGGEIFAGTAGTGHDLVIDQKDAVLIANFADPVIVAVGRNQCPGRCPANRFHDEAKDGFGTLFEDFSLKHVGIFDAAFMVRQIIAIQITGRGGDFRLINHHRCKGRMHRCIAGQGQRAQCRTMIAWKP